METTTTVDQINKLRQEASDIRELFLNLIPKWKANPHHYDKTGWGFNGDSRFSAHRSIPVQFNSHMGTYGSSSCSRQLSLDNNIFERHFLKYLDDHCEEIMLAVADSMEEEARSMKEKAQAELQEKLKSLEEL